MVDTATKKPRVPFHVVVANQAAARIFARQADSDSHIEYGSFVNPSARLELRELQADKVGRSFDRHGSGRHALDTNRNSKTQAAQRFAKIIAHNIRELLNSSKTHQYLVIAAPAFLGTLRQEIERESVAQPAHSIDKDITNQSFESVQRLLLKHGIVN